MQALKTLTVWAALAGLGLATIGCVGGVSRPPQTMRELEAHRQLHLQEYPLRTIALYNANRVLASDLPVGQRLESLQVVEAVETPEAEVFPILASIFSDADAPKPVRQGVLIFLARKGYPGLAEVVAANLPTADRSLRQALLDWLAEHPGASAISDVAKLWSAEKKLSDEDEGQYRKIVERMSGKSWEQALLDSLNSPDFSARGSVLELLAGRLQADALQKKILALPAGSEAVKALQYFITKFQYLPHTRRELMTTATLYNSAGYRLASAAEIVRNYPDYNFNIRDFHLLSRLSGDPLRKPIPRAGLVLEVSRAIAGNRGGHAGDPAVKDRMFRMGRLVDFDSQVEKLSIADLWNLLLVNEMLAKTRVHDQLLNTAQEDRRDAQTQTGGLVLYEQGQAEAMLYRPSAKKGDDQYVPSEAMLQRAADALVFFIDHFADVATKSEQIGPTAAEVEFMREQNVYGLILTTIENNRINAAYISPDGIVVDLGDY